MLEIVITSYNKKQWIKNVLQSIIKQYNHQIEVTIIDDCSNDGSIEYLKQHIPNDFSLIVNENNKGIGYVRQQAIDNATGEYLVFIDADDFITDDYIDTILKHIQTKKNVYAFRAIYYPDGEPIDKSNIFYYNVVWNKIYKVEHLKSNNMCFNIELKNGEDAEFNQQITIDEHIDKVLYYYNLLSTNTLTR